MTDTHTFTYQTRLSLAPEQAAALGAYADLYGRVERKLFAALAQGEDAGRLKNVFLTRFGMTARQYNAVRIALQGKIASIRERQTGIISEARARIKRTDQTVKALARKLYPRGKKGVSPLSGTGRKDVAQKLHQKKRRLVTLKARLTQMEADRAAGRVRLCFGSRKLFRKQFDLAANGYASLDEWRADWRNGRSAQFFVLGSKDETSGCQSCVATEAMDGSLMLCLRLPNALQGQFSVALRLDGVRFAWGHDKILEALRSSRRIRGVTKTGKPIIKRTGRAISYRFVCDAKGWRVFATTSVAAPAVVSTGLAGAVGIDLNADHLGLGEVDRFGNLVHTKRLDCVTYGLSQHQALARIGDAAKAIAGIAASARKPVVLEDLEFSKKKAALREAAPREARMLSAFVYHRTRQAIESACFRAGVEVIAVNPAYTSTIGAVNYARRLGVSIHQGAALAIARRGLGLSERPTVRRATVPMRNGGHVTFALPVRNRAKHVWSFWSQTFGALQATRVAWFRSSAWKRAPAPLPRFIPGIGRYPGSAGAIPARESPAALFG